MACDKDLQEKPKTNILSNLNFTTAFTLLWGTLKVNNKEVHNKEIQNTEEHKKRCTQQGSTQQSSTQQSKTVIQTNRDLSGINING